MMRLVSLCVSLGLLAVLYTRLNVQGLGAAFAASRPEWMALGLVLLVPLTLVPAWRLQIMMPGGPGLRFWESARLMVMASSLNLVMPAKTGDLAKAYYLSEKGHLPGPLAFALVVTEKALDLLALLAWCLVGLLLHGRASSPVAMALGLALAAGLVVLGSRRTAHVAFALLGRALPGRLRQRARDLEAAWLEAQTFFRAHPGRLAGLVLLTLGLWGLHMIQLWCCVLALGGQLPFLTHITLAPLAILAGLMPLTLTGIGPRDAAVVWLYWPYMSPTAGAALGLLFTGRYLVPAAVGLPFLSAYLAERRARPDAAVNEGAEGSLTG